MAPLEKGSINMATDIVQSLFGISPDMLQRQQDAMLDRQALQFAQMDPFERANYGIFRGSSQLGGALGRALGGQDPELARVSLRQSLAQQIDFNDPASIQAGVQALTQAGDTMGAMMLADTARKAMLNAQQVRKATAEARKLELGAEQEEKLRLELANLGEAPTQDQILGVVSKYGPSEKVLAALQTSADKAAQRTAAEEKAKLDREARLEAARVAAEARIEAERARGATAREIAQMRVDAQRQMADLNAQFKREAQERKEQERMNKPLPSYLQKEEEGDYTAARAASDLATDAYGYINRIKAGEIPFGFKERASIRARQLVGSNAPDVIARENYDKFITNLVNESLRLNKGTQTEGDAVRAAKELESSESPEAAAAAMRRLVEINTRRAKNAADEVLRRRKNANFPEPATPVQVPQFDVQILNNAEYERFLKDSKYPPGTIFVDPKGVRRVKP
ncbi:MAG: hypothetical protein ACK42H_07060 [Planctomycetota bacterium]